MFEKLVNELKAEWIKLEKYASHLIGHDKAIVDEHAAEITARGEAIKAKVDAVVAHAQDAAKAAGIIG